jgi:hypothetical protein
MVHRLEKLSDIAPINFLATQLRHVKWEGFHFNDLIFPLFVFMTGMSTAFSLQRIAFCYMVTAILFMFLKKPFLWVGTNPITIYVAYNMVNVRSLAERIVRGPVKDMLGDASALVVAMLMLGSGLVMLRFMYQRKVFLRI